MTPLNSVSATSSTVPISKTSFESPTITMMKLHLALSLLVSIASAAPALTERDVDVQVHLDYSPSTTQTSCPELCQKLEDSCRSECSGIFSEICEGAWYVVEITIKQSDKVRLTCAALPPMLSAKMGAVIYLSLRTTGTMTMKIAPTALLRVSLGSSSARLIVSRTLDVRKNGKQFS